VKKKRRPRHEPAKQRRLEGDAAKSPVLRHNRSRSVLRRRDIPDYRVLVHRVDHQFEEHVVFARVEMHWLVNRQKDAVLTAPR
jgi:hypothetical protein